MRGIRTIIQMFGLNQPEASYMITQVTFSLALLALCVYILH